MEFNTPITLKPMNNSAEEYFKKWSSVCRIFNKSDSLGLTYSQVLELMQGFHQFAKEKELSEISNKDINRMAIDYKKLTTNKMFIEERAYAQGAKDLIDALKKN